MSKRTSAGLLLYRQSDDDPQFFLVHPGGPFFRNKDQGHWTIPKGEIEEGEDPLAAAEREFREETGIELPSGPRLPLGEARQKSGKRVLAWGAEAHFSGEPELRSNLFELEWPKGSGQLRQFPEADRGRFFSFEEALQYAMPSQHVFLERLAEMLRTAPDVVANI